MFNIVYAYSMPIADVHFVCVIDGYYSKYMQRMSDRKNSNNGTIACYRNLATN